MPHPDRVSSWAVNRIVDKIEQRTHIITGKHKNTINDMCMCMCMCVHVELYLRKLFLLSSESVTSLSKASKTKNRTKWDHLLLLTSNQVQCGCRGPSGWPYRFQPPAKTLGRGGDNSVLNQTACFHHICYCFNGAKTNNNWNKHWQLSLNIIIGMFEMIKMSHQ